MALLGEVFFNVGIQSQKFDSGIKSMQRSANAFENTIKKLGTTLAAVFGTAGFIATMKKNLDLWAKQEESTIKLTFAVKQFASGNKQLMTNLQQLGNYMQKQIGVGNEYVENLAAIGLSMGVTGDRIEDATKASILLSKVLGTDAQTLMRGFAQTLEGTVGILGRYVPEVRNLTEEQLRNGEAIDLIVKKFTGLEETLSGTTTAAIDKFKASLGDIGEVMGSKLAPIVSKMANWMYEFSSRVQESGSVMQTLKDYALKVWDSMSLLGKGVVALVGAFIGLKIASAAWSLLTSAIITGGKLIVNVLSTIFSWPVLIIAGLYLLRVAWRYNWFNIRDTVLGAWDAMKAGWRGAYDDLKDVWQDPDLSFLEKVAASIGLIAGKIWKGTNEYDGLGTIWKKAWDKLVETWKDPDLSFLDKIKISFGTLALTAWLSARTIGAALTDAFGGDVQQYIQQTDDALAELKKTIDEFKEADTPIEKMKSAFEVAKQLYQMPATLVLSGFVKAEDFDTTVLDDIVNILTTTLGARLITGSWRIAFGLGLLADFIFSDGQQEIQEADWKEKVFNTLKGVLEAMGFLVLLTKTKFSVALPIALTLQLGKELFLATGDRQKALFAWRAWFEYTRFGAEDVLREWAKENLPAMLWQAEPNTLAQMAKDTFDKAFEGLSLINQGVLLGDTFVAGVIIGIQHAWEKVKDKVKNIFVLSEEDLVDIASQLGRQQKYYPLPEKQTGGYTANVGVDQIAGVVHGGEWVAPAWMVKRYSSLIGLLEAIRRRGYKQGGLVGYQFGGWVQGKAGFTIDEQNQIAYYPTMIDTMWGQLIETLMHDLKLGEAAVKQFLNTLKEKFGIDLPNNIDDIVSQFDELQEEADKLNSEFGEMTETVNNWQKILADSSELLEYNKETGELVFSSLGKLLQLEPLVEKITPAFTSFTKKITQLVPANVLNVFNTIFTNLVDSLVGFLVSIDSVNKILNPFTTILDEMFSILSPVIDSIFKPFADALSAIGRLLAGVLAPALNALKIALYPVVWIVTAFGWAIDQVVLWVNKLPFIGGFLTEAQKKEMSKSIEERLEGFYDTGTSPSGEEFTVGSTQQITNNFNFYFSDNMLLTEDDEGARRLAELVVKVLKEQGIEVVT